MYNHRTNVANSHSSRILAADDIGDVDRVLVGVPADRVNTFFNADLILARVGRNDGIS